ncbi:TPA: hypothetical protein ACIUJA_004406, partial [Salmonella enterica subsp. enterica serovar Arechavaleta]
GLMELNDGVNVTLSSPGAGWTPHTLSLGQLSSGGNHFDLYAARVADATGRYRTDQINITGGTGGTGNNALSLTFVDADGRPSDLPGSPDGL